jgi:hypothetical protein
MQIKLWSYGNGVEFLLKRGIWFNGFRVSLRRRFHLLSTNVINQTRPILWFLLLSIKHRDIVLKSKILSTKPIIYYDS